MKTLLVILLSALAMFAADPFYSLTTHSNDKVYDLQITDPVSYLQVQYVQWLMFQSHRTLDPTGSTQIYAAHSPYSPQYSNHAQMLLPGGFWSPIIPFGTNAFLSNGLDTLNVGNSGYSSVDPVNPQKGRLILAIASNPGAPTATYALAVDSTFHLQAQRFNPPCPLVGREFGCEVQPLSVLNNGSNMRTLAARGGRGAQRIEWLKAGEGRPMVWAEDDGHLDELKAVLAANPIPSLFQ